MSTYSNNDCAPPLTAESLADMRNLLKEPATIEPMPVAVEVGPDVLKLMCIPTAKSPSPYGLLRVYTRPANGWRYLYAEDLVAPNALAPMPLTGKELAAKHGFEPLSPEARARNVEREAGRKAKT